MLINERNNLQLDAEYIFRKIDKYNGGYITVRELADWLENVCGYSLQETERDLIQIRFTGKSGYKITLEDLANQVAPVIKAELEVDEENEDQEEADMDSQAMGQFEEEYINQEGGQRGVLSGNEEDASEDDGQMKGRYPRMSSQEPDEELDDKHPEFAGATPFGMNQPAEYEVPRDEDEDSDAGSGKLEYLQQVDDDGEQSPLADNE